MSELETHRPDPGTEDSAPHVYTVCRGLDTWHFNYRDILKVAGTVAAATAACGAAKPPETLGVVVTSAPVPTLRPALSLKDEAKCVEIPTHALGGQTLTMSSVRTLLTAESSKDSVRLCSLPGGELVGCTMHLVVSKDAVKGLTDEVPDASGRMLTYAMPRGAPVPAGRERLAHLQLRGRCSPDMQLHRLHVQAWRQPPMVHELRRPA